MLHVEIQAKMRVNFSLDGASGIGLDWIEMMKSYCRYTSPMDPRGNRYVFSNFV